MCWAWIWCSHHRFYIPWVCCSQPHLCPSLARSGVWASCRQVKLLLVPLGLFCSLWGCAMPRGLPVLCWQAEMLWLGLYVTLGKRNLVTCAILPLQIPVSNSPQTSMREIKSEVYFENGEPLEGSCVSSWQSPAFVLLPWSAERPVGSTAQRRSACLLAEGEWREGMWAEVSWLVAGGHFWPCCHPAVHLQVLPTTMLGSKTGNLWLCRSIS